MLLGPGGNIGVSIGQDGVYMIDDKFAQFGQEIIDVVGTLTDQPIKYVLNTHHHGDHSGANAEMKAVGATVVAHDNVRARMGISYMNQAFGGDSIVHFVNANIIHLGDNFFRGMLPFVDVDSGGAIQGMIAAQETAYDLADADTKIIPMQAKVWKPSSPQTRWRI